MLFRIHFQRTPSPEIHALILKQLEKQTSRGTDGWCFRSYHVGGECGQGLAGSNGIMHVPDTQFTFRCRHCPELSHTTYGRFAWSHSLPVLGQVLCEGCGEINDRFVMLFPHASLRLLLFLSWGWTARKVPTVCCLMSRRKHSKPPRPKP